MTQPIVKAISRGWSGRAREIKSDVGVSVARPILSDQDHSNGVEKFTAIWDTGATNSVVIPDLVKKLDLKPIGKLEVGVVGGSHIADLYMVNFYFPNLLGFTFARVTCSELPGDCDILLGMDVIGLGDFAITNKDGKTTFTFRVPSIEKIDFVENINAQNRSFLKKNRNNPCYCGSGKKTKQCHGKGI